MNDSEFKYELFFELSPDLLCIAGYDGYFKKVNAAVSNLLGYTMEELYARPINDFVHCADKRSTQRVRSELTKSKPLLNFHNRYVKKNGEIVWLSWTSLPVDGDQLVFAIAKDITHTKRMETDRNTLLTNLANTNEDLKQLTYTTSHDLRSPVNNLLAVLDLLDISKINDQEAAELIRIVKLSGDYLKKTLDNYVDALSEKHEKLAIKEEVDFNKSLTKVLLSINSLLETSKVTIHTDFSKLEKIKFNNAYMESVFLNLLTNSIKYARPDCLPVIDITSEKLNGRNQLLFSDNGMGFDMEKVKDKIFGLHQMFHNNIDSKGIGLYLVHNHITSFAGKITVESKVNEGAKFIMSFKDT
ncbi:MAG TPA: PAS domain-containing sensor histidine kinase [Prolixibacteraceae bacterium]|jgi:PAS domain S-box-containing protein|nr:PAS domain-containing sensor histidine kinase [Prolixibacteraceae bacterium]